MATDLCHCSCCGHYEMALRAIAGMRDDARVGHEAEALETLVLCTVIARIALERRILVRAGEGEAPA